MKRLYICDYPYILYSAMVKSLSEGGENDFFILNSFDEMKALYESMQKEHFASKLFFSEDDLYRQKIHKVLEYDAAQRGSKVLGEKVKYLWNGFSLIYRMSREIDTFHLPNDLDFDEYDEIYYSDRMSTMMFYLNKNNIKYYALQHARNTWGLPRPKASILKFKILEWCEKLRICCSADCYTKACKGIVVPDLDAAAPNIPHGKERIEWNLNDVVQQLSIEKQNKIFHIYAQAFHLPIDPDITYNLLLTNPLKEDSVLPSEKQQIRFYQDMVNQYFEKEFGLLIKPHPRDHVDYSQYFPNAVIVDKGIAAEVLNLGEKLKLRNVMTLMSSSVESFSRKAQRIIRLEEMNTRPQDMHSLDHYRLDN